MKTQINELFESALLLGVGAFFAFALFSAIHPQPTPVGQLAQTSGAAHHA